VKCYGSIFLNIIFTINFINKRVFCTVLMKGVSSLTFVPRINTGGGNLFRIRVKAWNMDTISNYIGNKEMNGFLNATILSSFKVIVGKFGERL